MAAKTRKKKSTRSKGGLLTLSEVSKRSGISMPTLQRYKKLYQDRIPSEGEGRKQRYPVSSLAVFKEIKKENISKRGRPRKSAESKALPPKKKRPTNGRRTKAKRAAASSSSVGGGDLLTLSAISDMTGISYPTLLRYKKLHLRKLPHEGKGRNLRFHPEAVEVFQDLRSKSKRGARKKSVRRGRPPGSGRAAAAQASGAMSKEADKRIKELEKAMGKLQRKFDSLLNKLKRAVG